MNTFSRFSLTHTMAAFALSMLTGSVSAQWHGDGTQRLEHCIQLQGLTQIPELHTDMPLDCLIGYIIMDSVAKTTGIYEITRKPANSLISQLRVASRYMYAMADYDPILLNRHFLSTMDSSFPNATYHSYPANFYFPILQEINKRKNEFGRDYSMLVQSNYVLHVRVTDVRGGIDSTLFEPDHKTDNINVVCEVIEIFKGQRLPDNCALVPHDIKHTGDEAIQHSRCIIYGEIPQPNMQKVQVGDEMIIFLNLVLERDNIWGLHPRYGSDRTGGRFLIRNGKVEDPDNIWGLGINPPAEEFRSILLKKINDIRTWQQ